MCPVPFNSARAFVALGSWLVEGTNYVCRQGLLRNGPPANSGGSGNRERISSGAPFYNGRHVTPRGCCCLVKQDHQFLNKISTHDIIKRFQLVDKIICVITNKSSQNNCHKKQNDVDLLEKNCKQDLEEMEHWNKEANVFGRRLIYFYILSLLHFWKMSYLSSYDQLGAFFFLKNDKILNMNKRRKLHSLTLMFDIKIHKASLCNYNKTCSEIHCYFTKYRLDIDLSLPELN